MFSYIIVRRYLESVATLLASKLSDNTKFLTEEIKPFSISLVFSSKLFRLGHSSGIKPWP